MSRSIFGWSLPPGCTHQMIDDAYGAEEPCQCCGHWVDDCICPECPECEAVGDPACYSLHGLKFSKEQLKGQEKLKKQIEKDREEEKAHYDEESKYWKEWESKKEPKRVKFDQFITRICIFITGVICGYLWCYYHWTH